MVNGMKTSIDKVALGITDDEVPLGSHLIHFWQTDEEFERGVRFLELGIADEFQHCVLFGHDEANHRVLAILRKTNRDLDSALGEGRLVILRRESSASVTLANIDAAFSNAVSKGATAIRYLGSLGMGQAPLPGRGAHDAVDLETSATVLALHHPCGILCMYDVNTVSGRLLLDGGFGTHPLSVCRGALRHNPYYAVEEGSSAA